MALVNRRSNGYYTDGNAARNISAAPEAEFPEIEKEKKRRSNRRALRRANKKNFVYLLIGIAASAVLFICCFQYLSLKSLSTSKATQIATLQEELNKITSDNNELEADINTNVNYNSIYNKAVGEYGMVYPSEGQIRTYSAEDSGYVKQYQNIP